jgi:hypothetical protein
MALAGTTAIGRAVRKNLIRKCMHHSRACRPAAPRLRHGQADVARFSVFPTCQGAARFPDETSFETKLPTEQSSFAELQTGGYLYIDTTQFMSEQETWPLPAPARGRIALGRSCPGARHAR